MYIGGAIIMKNNEINRLIEKSIESFILGIEIYNKPTLRYRIEGFSFFICNSWELMLKAYLIREKGESSKYYRDTTNRTISISECVNKVFTNKKDPIRKNLERIIELRNTSTHFITSDYENIYAPLFQASVVNFVNKTNEFHNKDITSYIPSNFLTLDLKISKLSDEEIKAKYPPEVVKQLLSREKKIIDDISNDNNQFAIPIRTDFYLTKNKSKADLIISIDSDSSSKVAIVKQVSDPNNKYPLTTKNVIIKVNKKMEKENITLTKINANGKKKTKFNNYDFQLFVKFYNIKDNKRYSFYLKPFKKYSYSEQLVDFLFEEIKKDSDNVIPKLKEGTKKR